MWFLVYPRRISEGSLILGLKLSQSVQHFIKRNTHKSLLLSTQRHNPFPTIKFTIYTQRFAFSSMRFVLYISHNTDTYTCCLPHSFSWAHTDDSQFQSRNSYFTFNTIPGIYMRCPPHTVGLCTDDSPFEYAIRIFLFLDSGFHSLQLYKCTHVHVI